MQHGEHVLFMILFILNLDSGIIRFYLLLK